MEKSAVIELESVITDEESDYEDVNKTKKNFDSNQSNESQQPTDLTGQLTQGVASFVWQEGRQKARKAFDLYANIDILRPYFDVEPKEVLHRLLQSFVPSIAIFYNGDKKRVLRELYGPTMIVLTLIALLLMHMKTSEITIREGTLIGSAFFVCFGYWIGISSTLWLGSYIFNIRLALLQSLHLMGYSMFSYCIVIFLTTCIHSSSSHTFFYLVWLIFGGLSVIKVFSVLSVRTNFSKNLLVLGVVISFFHLAFLLYLHFAYHDLIEVSEWNQQSNKAVDLPVSQMVTNAG